MSRTPDSTSDPAILQTMVVAAKLEASNLREELTRCRAQLGRLEQGSRSDGSRGDLDVAFSDLAMAMVNVLHRFPEFMELDRERRELVDLSAKPSERVVMGKERMGRFVEWVELNQALPMVQALVLGSAGKL
ncbi:hypothetical protein [Variovorax sp. dw_308]|uniref:hypothetical protein n=1 Tax=Variovorax sp. dw_308 TaxID=2721546 RepID=UPI001C44CCDE|nr:hypothetical protein [Variovorax sp. dw_308]